MLRFRKSAPYDVKFYENGKEIGDTTRVSKDSATKIYVMRVLGSF